VAHLVVGMRGPKFDCRKLAHIRTALGDFEGGFAHDGADVYARAHESRDTIEHLQVDDHWPGAHQPLLISWLPLHSPWRTGRCTAGRARYSRTHRASSVLLKRRRCRRCSSIRSTVCAPLLLLDCNATDPATPECVGSTRVAASACEAREPARHVTGRARLAAGGPNGLAAAAGCAPLERDSMHVNCHYTTFARGVSAVGTSASSLDRVVSRPRATALCLAQLRYSVPRARAKSAETERTSAAVSVQGCRPFAYAALSVHRRFRQLVYINGLEAPDRPPVGAALARARLHSSAALLCAKQPPAPTALVTCDRCVLPLTPLVGVFGASLAVLVTL
jgi:hypothetical protein